MSRVIIIGGHGKVGLLLSQLLSERGDDVVSVIRDHAQVPDIEATGACALVLSVEKASQDALADVLRGADAVVWTAGAGGKGGPARTDAVDRAAAIRSMEAALAVGVRRYVMVSFAGAHGQRPVPQDHSLYAYAMAKVEADHHLQSTGLDWTILGPGVLTLEPASGLISLGREGSEASAPTSRENVAQVIAAVLADDATIHRVIPFRDGITPVAAAVHRVPEEYTDLG